MKQQQLGKVGRSTLIGVLLSFILLVPISVFIFSTLHISYLENYEYRLSNDELRNVISEYSQIDGAIVCFFDKYSYLRRSHDDVFSDDLYGDIRPVVLDMPPIREGFWGVLFFAGGEEHLFAYTLQSNVCFSRSVSTCNPVQSVSFEQHPGCGIKVEGVN